MDALTINRVNLWVSLVCHSLTEWHDADSLGIEECKPQSATAIKGWSAAVVKLIDDAPKDWSRFHAPMIARGAVHALRSATAMFTVRDYARADWSGRGSRFVEAVDRFRRVFVVDLEEPADWSKFLTVKVWKSLAGMHENGKGSLSSGTWQRRLREWMIPERDGSTTKSKSFDLRYVHFLRDDQKASVREVLSK